jgi:cyclohexanone monooxygenase
VGFPNLFTITGPGSPSVLTNMLPSIEQHVDWIADCLEALRAKGVSVIEPVEQAEKFWAGEVGGAANITLRSTCSSWYVGANIPGKPRVFMPYIGGLPAYIERCEAVVAKGYEGFAFG